nr:DUF6153 family protein [Streptomyces sp. NBC_00857]
MRPSARPAPRPHGARAVLLLVLTVVAGLLAMHGLAMSPPEGTHSAPSAHAMTVGAPDCVQPDHGGGGHLAHADATCAAAGTGTGPAPHILTASALPSGTAHPTTAPRRAPGAPPGGPPPSLSELQLLRI